MLIFHSIAESTDERSCWADFFICCSAFLLWLYLSFEDFIYHDTAEAERSQRCTEEFMPDRNFQLFCNLLLGLLGGCRKLHKYYFYFLPRDCMKCILHRF